MALAATALVSLKEFNNGIVKGSDGGKTDERKWRVLERVSLEIEGYLDREIVTRGPLVEYHTVPPCTSEIYLSQCPLVDDDDQEITVFEDPGWQGKAHGSWYEASTALTENEDFLVIRLPEPAPFVKLLRIGRNWATGRRAIKVAVAEGLGYADTASVPGPIKAVALEFAQLVWRDQSRGEAGVQTVTDQMGTVTRHLPAILTAEMQRRLMPYRRIDFAPTWERDAAA